MVKSGLIADDNAFVRQRLGELFSREPDFEVCAVAENGRKAIEEAEESHPDLIFLDLSMLVMNCLDAARALKRLMREVPIVMFSIYSDSFTEKEARLAAYPPWSQNLRICLRWWIQPASAITYRPALSETPEFRQS